MDRVYKFFLSFVFANITFFYVSSQIIPGAYSISEYFPLINNKNVGIVCNHASLINKTHLIDTLIKLNIRIKKVFVPEHGLKGLEDAGKFVKDTFYKDIPVISLYGAKKKPTQNDLFDLDVVLFDLQDVGVRFYTYISTLHYVMEACAENKKELIILDRPNPLSFYVDGPVLDTSCCKSFIGLHPIPIVYGLSIGELANMINNEGWLKNKLKCNLTIIKCKNYKHSDKYILPINPSPNLTNMRAVYLYPSLCLFEGTQISIGRGTDFPFQVFGHPSYKGIYDFSFIPKSKPGAKNPLHKNKICYGMDLRNSTDTTFTLKYLLNAYKNFPNKKLFFNDYFHLIIGNKKIKQLIETNILDENLLKDTWKNELNNYLKLREKYLLYED